MCDLFVLQGVSVIQQTVQLVQADFRDAEDIVSVSGSLYSLIA